MTALPQLLNLQSPFCLVIGNPIAHSLSPLLHNTASEYHQLDLRYYALNLLKEDLKKLPELFNHNQFVGTNITLPYKTEIRAFLDSEDETAFKVGAVNTVIKENGRLKGYNTDVYGFSQALKPHLKRLNGNKAVVFGSGGASKAVIYGLIDLGMAEIAIVSRNPDIAAQQFEAFDGNISFYSYDQLIDISAESELFVNATPLGMEPDIKSSPVPTEMEHILRNKICYDIVYKPLKTYFLRQAYEQGATIIEGLDMFVYQGAKAFELWTGKQLPFDLVKNKIMTALD